MKTPKLTYANVVSALVVFLALAGGTAFAASHLGKSSVGKKQLKANAVTTAKIKKNAVTAAKIKAKAVTGAKIADGAVTGAKIDAGSTSFRRVVTTVRNPAQMSFGAGSAVLVGTYTQKAGEDNVLIGSVDVTFDASCAAPREAGGYLLVDVANLASPANDTLLGEFTIRDTQSGAATVRRSFGPYQSMGPARPLYLTAPQVDTAHTFSVYLTDLDCNSGSGGSASGATVDVIGVR